MHSPHKQRLYQIIFEADSRSGKLFDVMLLLTILASISVVMLESVQEIRTDYGPTLRVLEWVFTGLFSLEYLLRLYCVRHPSRYALSFFGVIDFLAVLPTYLSLLFGGAQSLVVIRTFRLLRVFRVFKLVRFLGEASVLGQAIRASVPKLIVFLVTVLSIVVVIGTTMYLIESPSNPGFQSIPQSVYWSIVTVTTVGYGDTYPVTVAGKMLASVLMVTGFGILAVPTGIVTAEIVQRDKHSVTTRVCRECLAEGHDTDAVHCKYCGSKFADEDLSV